MGLTHRPQVDPAQLAALYAAAGLGAPESKAWDEAAHPRDAAGQFTVKRGSGYKSKGKEGEAADVRAVQARLVELGLLSKDSGRNGGVDGLFGPKTEAALREFQRVEGLPVTGEADPETVAALKGAGAGPDRGSAAERGGRSRGDRGRGRDELRGGVDGPDATRITDSQETSEYEGETYGDRRRAAKREGRKLHEDEVPNYSSGGARLTDFRSDGTAAYADGWSYDVDGWHPPRRRGRKDLTGGVETKAGPRHQPGNTRNDPDAALEAPTAAQRRRADARAVDDETSPRAGGRGPGAGIQGAAGSRGSAAPAQPAPVGAPVEPTFGPAKAVTEAQTPPTNPTTGAVRVEWRTGSHGRGEALYRDGSRFDGDGWHEGQPWTPPSLTAGPAATTGSATAKNAAESLAEARARGQLLVEDVPEQGANGARRTAIRTDAARGLVALYDDGSTFDLGGWHAPGTVPTDGEKATKETPVGMLSEKALVDLESADLRDLDTDDVAFVAEQNTVEEKGSRASLNRSPRSNWVEETGELPGYIREVARSISQKRGVPLDRAIPIAIGTIRRWARGGGDVEADTRAKAAAAIAAWEALKGKNRARMAGRKDGQPDGLEAKGGWENGAQGAPAGISYKEVPVESVVDVDERRGIVTAIVSVTGVRDRVGDIIEPGAYAKTLQARKPKGVWSHDWNQPISKTLEVRELTPGDPMLPSTIRGGEPWPAEAGALLVKTQFNLLGERGRQAFADVVFFAEDQEWSIGYNVPAGGSKVESKAGLPTRRIRELDLYEYSPVLFGAMPAAATLSVKSAQAAYRGAMAAVTASELERLEALRDGVETKAWRLRGRQQRDSQGRFADVPGVGDDAPAGGVKVPAVGDDWVIEHRRANELRPGDVIWAAPAMMETRRMREGGPYGSQVDREAEARDQEELRKGGYEKQPWMVVEGMEPGRGRNEPIIENADGLRIPYRIIGGGVDVVRPPTRKDRKDPRVRTVGRRRQFQTDIEAANEAGVETYEGFDAFRRKKADLLDGLETKARRGGAPTGGWQPCRSCGGKNRDEFADGTARCEDCGTELVHGTARGAKGLQLDTGMTPAQAVAALAAQFGLSVEVKTEPVETKALMSEMDLMLARRAALAAD